MKSLKWPCTSEQSEYMRMRLYQNRALSFSNRNENWMAEKLKTTGFKWTSSVQWGYRIFDFWCAKLGLVVEVDGPEHDIKYDNYRDEYNYRRSGILVLRVRNRNEDDASAALRVIAESETWAERRHRLGIDGKTKQSRRKLVTGKKKRKKGWSKAA
jgi:very-short-patch-repair endonuclease